MHTHILSGNKEDIKKAAIALRNGKLVAFPTETVYGLGANALDQKAVAKIFKAKGRPQDNPLIAHIGAKEDLDALVLKVPKKAKILIDAFWPGPLTIVLQKSGIVPEIITAGLPSVAVRMPSLDIALDLIKKAGVPIAAPSANTSGRPSPTSAKHVIEDLRGRIDYIIDGGRTRIGVESTVIDLTVDPPVLLRPGGITKEEIEKKIGQVRISRHGSVAKSPGMKYRHYSPRAEVILTKDIQKSADNYMNKGYKVGIMATDKTPYSADRIRYIGKSNEQIAKNLFEAFRDLDKYKVDIILIKGVNDNGLGLAIMNRLKKASTIDKE